MKFKLINENTRGLNARPSQDLVNEEYYYKVTYTYQEQNQQKRDYIYAIGRKDAMDRDSKELLKINKSHEKQGKELPDDYTIVDVKPVDKKDVIRKDAHLFQLTDSRLRSQTRTTIKNDSSIKELNIQNGFDSVINHHPEGNELLTKDKRFIDSVPYNKNDKISKMIANTIHQAFEYKLLNRSGKSSFKHPVYIYNPSTKKYEQHNITVSFE